MRSKPGFLLARLRERLWFKPLLYCIAALIAAALARAADFLAIGSFAPEISSDTIEKLLTIISSSMLAVATFAVASMISAFASASRSATPRSFALVIADDVSQTALSSFIGAFIFSVVALVALKSGLFSHAGMFVAFLFTLAIFGWVILTFVRWVDNIARLGRLGSTIDKIERATHAALMARAKRPRMGGMSDWSDNTADIAIHCGQIGYVQHIDMQALQDIACDVSCRIKLATPTGGFVTPDRPLAFVSADKPVDEKKSRKAILEVFTVGKDRTFQEDPRFGLIALSEIASRALSPAVNDPGTAIAVIGVVNRLLTYWAQAQRDEEPEEIVFDRIYVQPLDCADLFEDAFTGIARDGAGMVEVGVRLQKCLSALTSLGHEDIARQSIAMSEHAVARARLAINFEPDIARIEACMPRR